MSSFNKIGHNNLIKNIYRIRLNTRTILVSGYQINTYMFCSFGIQITTKKKTNLEKLTKELCFFITKAQSVYTISLIDPYPTGE